MSEALLEVANNFAGAVSSYLLRKGEGGAREKNAKNGVKKWAQKWCEAVGAQDDAARLPRTMYWLERDPAPNGGNTKLAKQLSGLVKGLPIAVAAEDVLYQGAAGERDDLAKTGILRAKDRVLGEEDVILGVPYDVQPGLAYFYAEAKCNFEGLDELRTNQADPDYLKLPFTQRVLQSCRDGKLSLDMQRRMLCHYAAEEDYRFEQWIENSGSGSMLEQIHAGSIIVMEVIEEQEEPEELNKPKRRKTMK